MAAAVAARVAAAPGPNNRPLPRLRHRCRHRRLLLRLRQQPIHQPRRNRVFVRIQSPIRIYTSSHRNKLSQTRKTGLLPQRKHKTARRSVPNHPAKPSGINLKLESSASKSITELSIGRSTARRLSIPFNQRRNTSAIFPALISYR